MAAGLNKATMDLLVNIGIIGGLAIGGWYAYNNNLLGIKNMIDSIKGGVTGAVQGVTGALPPPPAQQTPSLTQLQQTGSIPNLSGFETGYSPGAGPIPGGAPGIDYSSAIYESPFGTPSIDPRTGIDYSLYYPPTGTGTLPGTNPTPYPNPCLPGYYRASDLKCYPIPTQFPGSGCGEGMYLANDGRCYPYPGGVGGGGYGAGGGGYGVGGGYAPTPCPAGEYRASDGRCYALPTPPPEACPTGAYRASDGKCYPITPGGTVGDCPAGYTLGSDGVCRASTQCPAGYVLQNGVCVLSQNQQTITCPAGYYPVNGVCTPIPNASPLSIPLGSKVLVKELPPGVSPSAFSREILRRDPYRVDVDWWRAVQVRPQLTGGVPAYAVIIKAVDDSEKRDAITRAGFRQLTPDDLMKYIDIAGGFLGSTNTRMMRNYNRRVLNRYR